MNELLRSYLQLANRTTKKCIKEEVDKFQASIVFPEFDETKLELPDSIKEALDRLEASTATKSPNDEYEVLHFISNAYREQLQQFTLDTLKSQFDNKNLKRQNHELVYCPVEYLVELNGSNKEGN